MKKKSESESETTDEEEKSNKEDKNVIEIDKESGLKVIKCEERKQFKHPDDKFGLFVNGSVRIIINGKSGTGKSMLLRKIIPMLHKPKHLFICTTVIDNNVHKGIEKWCKNEKIKFHFNLNPDDFMEDFSDVIEKKKTNDHIILIFDDFSQGHTSKDDPYNNCTIRSFSKYRNYNVSCIIISPDVCDIKTNVRNSANIRILFPCKNAHGIQQFKLDLHEEFPNLPTQKMQQLYDFICNNKYTFILWGDTIKDDSCPHIRIGFDNIVWKQDSHIIEQDKNDKEKKEEEKEIKNGGTVKIDRRSLNHNKHGNGLQNRNTLMLKAIKAGLPPYLRNFVSLQQAINFLKYMERTGQKEFKGSHDKLMQVLGDTNSSKQTLLQKLHRHIKRYNETGKSLYWNNINNLGKELIEKGYCDKWFLKILLERKGILSPEED